MTVTTLWPWAADQSPVTPPTGLRNAVAALAIADLDDVHRVMRQHLAPMTAAVLSTLGLPATETSGLIPPATVMGRTQGIAHLSALRSELQADGSCDLVPVAGWSLQTAHEALLAGDPARSCVFVMSMPVHAACRAGSLS